MILGLSSEANWSTCCRLMCAGNSAALANTTSSSDNNLYRGRERGKRSSRDRVRALKQVLIESWWHYRLRWAAVSLRTQVLKPPDPGDFWRREQWACRQQSSIPGITEAQPPRPSPPPLSQPVVISPNSHPEAYNTKYT